METGFVKSDGLDIYYEVEGQGQPLLTLHGGPGIPHGYMKEVGSLSQYARVVFFDQRGTGRSQKTDPAKYTIGANVEDVENVRRGLGLGRCVVFGHSWGGMLAQAYVLKYPKTVSKLILANTFSSVDQLNTALVRLRASVPDDIRRIYERYEAEGLYKGRDRYPDDYQRAVDIAYEPFSMSVPRPEYFQEAFKAHAWDVYRAMWGEENEFRITGTMRNFNFLPRLHEIQVPALVMVGARDMTTIEMAQETARGLPNARLVVFEKTRHYPFIEEKQKFLEVMQEFLEEN